MINQATWGCWSRSSTCSPGHLNLHHFVVFRPPVAIEPEFTCLLHLIHRPLQDSITFHIEGNPPGGQVTWSEGSAEVVLSARPLVSFKFPFTGLFQVKAIQNLSFSKRRKTHNIIALIQICKKKSLSQHSGTSRETCALESFCIA